MLINTNRQRDTQTQNIFWGKTTDIDNQYFLYSRTCADGSSMLEGIYFTVSYTYVFGIQSLCNIISIVSVEDIIIFFLYISNAFHNTILLNLEVRVYLSLPFIYLDW